MPRGRTLVWTIIGCVIAVVAVVLAVIHSNSGSSPNAASSPVSASSTQAGESAPVVVPQTSGTASLAYLSDLHPSGNFGELVNPGPVTISGSIYPKSISFYCNVGDPTAFPAYKLRHNARRFQATIGLAPKSPRQFQAALLLDGDGSTLRTVTVSVLKPKTVDINVKGVHTLQLECFGSGNSATGGEAVAVVWGNARVVGGR